MAVQYLEELIYKFLSKTLTDEEKRYLSSGWDAEKHIDEETEYELKTELFYFLKSRIVWSGIIAKLQDEAEEEEEDSTGDEESCCGSGEEED